MRTHTLDAMLTKIHFFVFHSVRFVRDDKAKKFMQMNESNESKMIQVLYTFSRFYEQFSIDVKYRKRLI